MWTKQRWLLHLARCLIVLGLLLPLLSFPRALYAQGPPEEEQHILVLNSYHHGLSWTDNIVRGLRDLLEPVSGEREVYLEYMDTKRFAPSPDYYAALAEAYRERYEGLEFDVIIVADNDALNFIREYHAELFPGVPIVFCGINFFAPHMIEGLEEVITGVAEDIDIEDTLDLMLRLHPQTERIYVINDATTTGLGYIDLMQEITPSYQEEVEFIFYIDPEVGALQADLRDLPPNSLIFMLLLNRDATGQFFTYEQAIDLVVESSSVPIYGTWDFYMDRGLVGGKLTNGYSQGAAAGMQAAQVLDGTPVQTLPVVTSPNRYIFDYRELQRFGIELAALPAGAELRHRPPTFQERYGGVLLPALGVFVALSAVIGLQMFNSARQRQVEEELRHSHLRLEEARDTLEERVVERTGDLERRTNQLAVSATIARDAAMLRDVDALLSAAVNLISERYQFYHAGIFLATETGEYAALRAASSEGGQRMLTRGHRLERGVGIVGYVLETGKPRIALAVGEDAVWFNNPDLPETQSELGLPLTVRGSIIGVLDVQSSAPEAFTSEDVEVLQTLADQLALAIDNAQLFEESQRMVTELQRLYGTEAGRAWHERSRYEPIGYRYTRAGLERVPLAELERGGEASEEDAERRLVAQIPLRDQILAAVELVRAPHEPPWSAEERALVEAVTTQAGLALENARLLEETQSRAARERLIGSITSRMRAEVEIQSLLERALGELGRALDARRAVVELEVQS